MFRPSCTRSSSTPTIPSKPTTAGSRPGYDRCEVKRFRSAQTLAAGHAFVQNLRRGHYEIATDEPEHDRLRIGFAEPALAV